MAYSFSQLEGLWDQAGGPRALAPVMAAIALAESGGNPRAVNPTDNGGRQSSFGLWQISTGTHTPPASNWADPLENARLAVGKYHSQGLGAWGTYTSGAYKHFLQSGAPTGTGQGSGTTAGSRGSGGVSGTPNAPNAPSKPGGGSLGGFFSAIKAGLEAGLQVSSGSGNIIAQDIQVAQTPNEIAQAIATLTLPFTVLANAVDWFFAPSHWIRIFAGVGGGVLAIGGVYQLTHTGEDKPAALPLGIGMTGAGLVLLFVAFHNLDPNVKTVGEAVAHVQGKVQTDLAATTSPAAAVGAAQAAPGGGG